MTIPTSNWQQDIARGRAFEAKVRSAWRDAGIWPSGEEQLVRAGRRKGYIDLWDDAAGLLVICELKSVDWARRHDVVSVMRTVRRHRNQIFGYLIADEVPDDVQLIVIYDHAPDGPALREAIESYLEDWSINVLWWDDQTTEHWLIPTRPPAGLEETTFPAMQGRTPSEQTGRGRTRIVERLTIGGESPTEP